MPVLVQEETLLFDFDMEQYKSITGHEQQQLIKLIFWKLNNDIANCVTLDSDIVFTSSFDDSIFSEKFI